ncbi:hypothetical protein [Streptomyces sp. NPDC093589]|uniref:hypothetical protein n=1 Tax=Streptomyces sp. NPDC093589 TaxID=3366043 RepID=UPI00380F7312
MAAETAAITTQFTSSAMIPTLRSFTAWDRAGIRLPTVTPESVLHATVAERRAGAAQQGQVRVRTLQVSTEPPAAA